MENSHKQLRKPLYRNSTLAKCISIIIASLPALVFLSTQSLGWSLESPYLLVSNIGKTFGLLGIGFFSLNLLLSGRYRFLDVAFDGLDKLYLFHRRIGQVAFVFLTLHILAVTGRNVFISTEFYLLELTNLRDMGQNLGKITYSGLLVIIGLTMYWKGKYEIVKKLHTGLGFLLFFGGLHAFLMKTDLSTNGSLRVVVLILVTTALLSFIFRTLLEGYFVKKHRGRVESVERIGGNINQITVKLDGDVFKRMPGQFSWVQFADTDLPVEKHPFTISSGATEDMLRYSIKMSGDFTSELSKLDVGSPVSVEGPYGGFTNIYDEKDQIWIAGGIGITPFMSMIRTIDQSAGELRHKIKLYYSYRGEEDKVFLDELIKYSKLYPNFDLELCDTESRGRLGVEEYFNGVDSSYYICGPKAMIKSVSNLLQKKGVKNRDIHYELFTLYR